MTWMATSRCLSMRTSAQGGERVMGSSPDVELEADLEEIADTRANATADDSIKCVG